MDIVQYILFSTLISILLTVPGILIDIWLCKIGTIRGSKKAIIIGTFLLVFLKPLMFENISWWVYGTILLLGMSLSVHRIDLRETIKHGKWWWKPKDKKRNVI